MTPPRKPNGKSRRKRRPAKSEPSPRAIKAREDATSKRMAERRNRTPLKYSFLLAQFTCFCQRLHTASPDVVRCECGRSWQRQPAT